jgi:hypothetical protein
VSLYQVAKPALGGPITCCKSLCDAVGHTAKECAKGAGGKGGDSSNTVQYQGYEPDHDKKNIGW